MNTPLQSRTRLATLTGAMCSTSQCELRSTFPNVRVTNIIHIVTYYTLPWIESPTSSWMTRSQRSRRRDLEEGVTGKILKFADNTKLFRKVKEIGDKQNLQDDIDKLVKWSEKWQMLFNFGKCKCLHTGPGNTGMNYEMGGTILSKTVKEKDLGVTMNANMKVSEQCRIAASKRNQILGMIRRNITYKEKSLIIPLYKAIVRPHLEYCNCIQAWNPHLRKDVDMLESIQRRSTKLIPGLRDLTYEERLKECGLTTLETRRLRGDQIELFKILSGYENIDSNTCFEIKESKITRGHNYTLVKKQSILDVRKYSFSPRTINVWNNLSTDCVHM